MMEGHIIAQKVVRSTRANVESRVRYFFTTNVATYSVQLCTDLMIVR